MIRVVDYGLGNVQAFITVFKRLGVAADRARTQVELKGASKIILPGVGAFDDAIAKLNGSGLRPLLQQMVFEKRVPLLGVCVGMQMLASGSDEGVEPGLGWIAGRVRALRNAPEATSLPLPHMGWNQVATVKPSQLVPKCDEDPWFYFLHSYYFAAADPEDVVATSRYGLSFPCIVSRGHIHGVQFHPEKSHNEGALLLKNFAEYQPC